MILYDKKFDPNFSIYGIEIPIRDDRPFQIYNHIKKSYGEKYFLTGFKLSSLSREDLLLAHSIAYVDQLLEDNPEQIIEEAFELVDREGKYNRYNPTNAIKSLSELRDSILLQAYGSYLAMRSALDNNFCYFLGGGMHHAMSFGGRGFCLVNDIVIGIRKLQQEKKITTAWIIDLDAHKGDGCAEICYQDSTIKTFSIHMKDGWPLDSGNLDDPWFIPNDVDVEVSKENQFQYLSLLKNGLDRFASGTQTDLPDLAVVVAGADPHEADLIPSSNKLNLSYRELLERDKIVDTFLHSKNIPTCYLIAGGYGPDAWKVYANFIDYAVDCGRFFVP